MHIVKGSGTLRLCRTRSDGWTKARRTIFLDHLAATCNLKGALRAVGMTAQGARALRRRDPAFAQLWQEAMEQGYEVLERELLARAIGGGENPAEVDGDNAVVPEGFDPALALKILAQRDNAARRREFVMRGGAKRTYKHVTDEEVEAVLIKHLDAIEKKLAGS